MHAGDSRGSFFRRCTLPRGRVLIRTPSIRVFSLASAVATASFFFALHMFPTPRSSLPTSVGVSHAKRLRIAPWIQSNPIQSNPPAPRRLLETRGGLIIRKLCVLLQPKTIYVALASVLQTNSDLAFIGVMVEVRFYSAHYIHAYERRKVCWWFDVFELVCSGFMSRRTLNNRAHLDGDVIRCDMTQTAPDKGSAPYRTSHHVLSRWRFV